MSGYENNVSIDEAFDKAFNLNDLDATKEQLINNEKLTTQLEAAAIRVQAAIERKPPIRIDERESRWIISIKNTSNDMYSTESYSDITFFTIQGNQVTLKWALGHDLSFNITSTSPAELDRIVRITNLCNKVLFCIENTVINFFGNIVSHGLIDEYGVNNGVKIFDSETMKLVWLNMEDFVSYMNERRVQQILNEKKKDNGN